VLTAARRLVRRFRRGEDGASAVEFGLLAPVLVILLTGAVEFSGAITASNRSIHVADALAEMVSRVDHAVTNDELKNYALTAALVDPEIVKYARVSNTALEQAFKVTISSVQFEPKSPTCVLLGCAYEANVVFSYTLNGTKRSCGKLTPAAATAQSSTTLPSDVYGPGSLVVVDVEVPYATVLPVRLAKTLTFKRSAYFRPRHSSRIESQNDCAGY
jgi:Flp pilus assembly protein TadG